MLTEEQLNYYSNLSEGLISKYLEAFGRENVLHVPIDDFKLIDKKSLSQILSFLKNSDRDKQPVLVHCSGGLGRTGQVLAAWLVFKYELTPDEAVKEVLKQGRNPLEAIEEGQATLEELNSLLETVGSKL